jgi:hypothetical protein
MADLPLLARVFATAIPAADREAILGDLLEDAEYRDLRGMRRAGRLMAECGAIAARLSLQRARSWVVLPPVREVAAGFVVDGRGLLRGDMRAAIIRALIFCGSILTLALGVEVLVRTLFSAAGL